MSIKIRETHSLPQEKTTILTSVHLTSWTFCQLPILSFPPFTRCPRVSVLGRKINIERFHMTTITTAISRTFRLRVEVRLLRALAVVKVVAVVSVATKMFQ